MAISDWPMQERPREKLLRLGAHSLSEAELLAIFLQTGIKGQSALDISRHLLIEHKTLRGLLAASLPQVESVSGLGKAKFCILQAALELGKRLLEEDLMQACIISNALEAKKFLIAKLSSYKQEVFSCLFLNAKHHLIKYSELFYGTIHFTPIYPRVIAQKALEYNASALILAHNHPSGSILPSQSDITATEKLVSVLNILDISVLDHIIVGGNKCVSFTEKGLL